MSKLKGNMRLSRESVHFRCLGWSLQPPWSQLSPTKKRTSFSPSFIPPIQTRSDHASDHLLSDQLVESVQPSLPDTQLISEDNRPCAERSWTLVDFLLFWLAMVVCIPTFLLSNGLILEGFSATQALLVILVGTLLTLIPMIASAHPGTKYGAPFPVLARAAFGINGAHIPSISRAIVACGWYGISTWIGGSCLHQLIDRLAPLVSLDQGWSAWALISAPGLGISITQTLCFSFFWTVQVIAVSFGINAIKKIEKGCAPLLVASSLALLSWSLVSTGGSLGPLFSNPAPFIEGGIKEGLLLPALCSAITSIVAFWGTLALNISDFSRYALNQKSQAVGQAIALPLSMLAFAWLSLVTSSCTVLTFGGLITDPVTIVGKMEGPTSILALLALMVATLSTNVAANVVGPANAVANLNPLRISFNQGSFATATIGALIQPWRLVGSEAFFNFLLSYSCLLGPILGVFLTDYWIIRKCELDVSSLYQSGPKSKYWYSNGWNIYAIIAVLAGLAPTLPGCLASLGFGSVSGLLQFLFKISFFVGATVSSSLYYALMTHQ